MNLSEFIIITGILMIILSLLIRALDKNDIVKYIWWVYWALLALAVFTLINTLSVPIWRCMFSTVLLGGN